MNNQNVELAEFVQARWPRLVRAAVLLGCSAADAEDLVQSTLVRCLIHWDRVRRADDADAYVHRVLVNTLNSSRRRRWHSERPTGMLAEQPVLDQALEHVDQVDALVRSLQKLEHKQRVAVVLRYYGNFTEQQMAAILGVAPGTVKSRLSRAMETLAHDPDLAELGGLR